METWGVILAWGQVNRLGVEGNCVYGFVMVLGLGGPKREGVYSMKEMGASHKEGDNFYRGVDPLTSLSELPTYFSLFWYKKIFMICLT